ncbi:hypothetical protein [Listeria welshimeri]|uniref:hypothetical protein n=1 Tax=Listeria welshimeri TaxID=1643 RepID=UPI002B26E3A1|nr:hypothetical protein [Listeria welshimeri]
MKKLSAKNYNDVLRMTAKNLIEQDGLTLIDLLINANDSVINLSLIPFCALYCRSAKEFLNINSNNNEADREVTDIRNGLKIFTEKFSKGKKMAYNSDNQENEHFKSMLRFRFTKEFNIHLNLGVYFDKHGKVIFNTQLANFYLNIPKNKGVSMNEHASMVGKRLSEETAEILLHHCHSNNLKNNRINHNDIPKYGYIDFNTNKKNVFFCDQFNKETNLIFLHMLSTVGFTNNILIPILPNRDTWLLRIMYINVHNTILGIKKVIQHLKQNSSKDFNIPEIDKYLNDGFQVFSSSFRNCMMHYDLIDNKGCPVILQKFYNPSLPLNGLIESCYDGMNYSQYFDELYKTSQKLEDYLLSLFTINYNRICWDWD